MSFLLKIIPAVLFWIVFIYTLQSVPYPETFTQANFTQVCLFFIPLLLALILTFNIFINFFISFPISLGLVFLLILKALNSLNIVTGILIAISIGLFLSYFRKNKKNNLNPIKSDLTKLQKIPKLTQLRKQ